MNIYRIAPKSCLTAKQKADVQELVDVCCEYDGVRLSYPLEEAEGDCMHYLMSIHDGEFIGALALVFFEEWAECSAFVHPKWRRRGCFSDLLRIALEDYDETDILFWVSEQCADTMAVLKTLRAELEGREHQMELELTQEAVPHYAGKADALLTVDCDKNGDDALWHFARREASETTAVGSCQTAAVSEECVCLHHVEVEEHLRGLGFGTAMLCVLLPRLFQEGIRKVILQVSENNAPAMALYKKTGFRITETLSCYLY